MCNLPFLHSLSYAKHPFDLIHTDLWGPAPVLSADDFRYYVLFIDDHSQFTWIYPLKQKSDTTSAIKDFQSFVQTQFGKMIKLV